MHRLAVVAVFCGPHDNDGGVSFRRIDRAIAVALKLGIPLLIAGDANGREDIRLFAERARLAGVKVVYGLHDSRASTLYDARSVADCLHSEPELSHIHQVHLVTDSWHMARSLAMLAAQLRDHLDGWFDIRCENVGSGPEPTREVLDHEHEGLLAFINETYDPYTLVRAPHGKPQPHRAVAC